ncbi:hypothetical protein BJX70DRAFT_171924 [Aspergillus crustosus]
MMSFALYECIIPNYFDILSSAHRCLSFSENNGTADDNMVREAQGKEYPSSDGLESRGWIRRLHPTATYPYLAIPRSSAVFPEGFHTLRLILAPQATVRLLMLSSPVFQAVYEVPELPCTWHPSHAIYWISLPALCATGNLNKDGGSVLSRRCTPC